MKPLPIADNKDGMAAKERKEHKQRDREYTRIHAKGKTNEPQPRNSPGLNEHRFTQINSQKTTKVTKDSLENIFKLS
jgi:hypothetical protein